MSLKIVPTIDGSAAVSIQDVAAGATYLSNEDLAVLRELKQRADANVTVAEKSYEYVPTEDVVQSVGDWLTENGYEFTARIVTGAKGKSTKHIAEFTLTNVHLFAGEGGGNGKILVINSYNAECSLYVLAGAIRFCCANGIIAGEKQFFEKVVHRAGEVCRQKLMMLNEKIKIAAEYLKTQFGSKVTEMAAADLKFTKAAEIVLNLTIPNQAKLLVIERIHPTNIAKLRKEDQPQNLWTLFNIINECIREAARHEMSEFEHNTSLMDDVIRLAKAA
jgi:hypothetical protein